MQSQSGRAQGGATSTSPQALPVIRKLDEHVVNKIAAGEVIQRPASALKEMLENSLDAGATSISVVVKEGGNKLLQITDNGHGIRKEDLPILCHRHTTSKLSSFEDLETISTLGFRGEALCSISFVSHMAVTTMARGAQYGYRVTYKDSEMEAPGPRPVAAVPGTTITVEDLFYNVPTRRKALRSASEEYSHILDVLQRYAVYSAPRTAFNCRRHGDTRPDLVTTANAAAAAAAATAAANGAPPNPMLRLDAVRAVYGADVTRELLPLVVAAGGSTGPEVPVDGPMGLRVEGLISGANYVSGKKTVLVFFINGRAVDCPPLRRTLEGLYGSLLPKAARPWLFLDVRLPPRHVEVNMHPTKREVGFLHQDEVIEEIRAAVESKLLASNDARTFATAGAGGGAGALQTQLPFAALHSQQQQQQQQDRSRRLSRPSGDSDDEEGGKAVGEGAGTATGGAEEDGGDGEGEDLDGEDGEEDEDGRLGRGRAGGSAAAGGGGGGRQAGRKRAAAGGGGGGSGGGGGQAVPYRPEKLVRTDFRTGTLDTFVVKQTAAAAGSAATATATAAAAALAGPSVAARAAAASGSVARRRGAIAAGSGGALGVLEESTALDGGSGGAPGDERAALPPGVLTEAVLGLRPLGSSGQEDAGLGPSSIATAGAAAATAARPPVAARRTPPAPVTRRPEVRQLIAEAEADGACHLGLAELLREHTFVGMADGSLALLQHGTRLYLVDVGALSGDMFYQLALRRWDQAPRLALEPAPRVSELVALGLQVLELKGEWQPDDGSPEELGGLVAELVQQHGPQLDAQLGIAVDGEGRLLSLPLLLEGYAPDPARLPDFVMALAKDVEWDEPVSRARTLARALADLHAVRPPLQPDDPTGPDGPRGQGGDAGGGDGTPDPGNGAGPGGMPGATEAKGATGLDGKTPESQWEAYEHTVKHVVLAAMRGCLRPPRRRATDGSVVQVAALERLYRIFERC